ncbi:hypothetical protein [Caldinitratiruptor microaerophilus]|uniref:Uncharacterized protein n=1 Tax=Caldinitratiruptor microaerophilus TaxID=671077 RepID=A0AA35CPD3_9FIRM|nr:hypothetical protein [Caldinitratiruptor microaerophilus]BDG62363.1 hypothetical protein caldi_34530 [Caldinitratiruptor microaerophilus]
MRMEEWVSAAAEANPTVLGAAAAGIALLAGTRQGRKLLRGAAVGAARAGLRFQDVLWNMASRTRQSWTQILAEARAATPAIHLAARVAQVPSIPVETGTGGPT